MPRKPETKVLDSNCAFQVSKGVFVDFAHFLHGHDGPCHNIHGHTWYLEITLGAPRLDTNGFVLDFSLIKTWVLDPVRLLLDHSLVINYKTPIKLMLPFLKHTAGTEYSDSYYTEAKPIFKIDGCLKPHKSHLLCGACTYNIRNNKITCFAFPPTSERLAEWLYRVASKRIKNPLRVICARVFEQLHPTPSVATYFP